MKHFTTVQDVPDVEQLILSALQYKQKGRIPEPWTQHKKVGLIFFNPSLRTRLSAQVALQNLGVEAIVLDIGKDGWALEIEEGVVMNSDKAEHIKEAAAVMGSYFDVLAIRTFPELKNREDDEQEKVLQAFIKYSGIPVVSLESATLHPLQSLADVMTIRENWANQHKPKIVLTWAPHVKPLPQAVPNSFVEWMQALDADLTLACPSGYELAPKYINGLNVCNDQKSALEGADFVYVKNWSSYQNYGKVLSKDLSWTFGLEQHRITNQAKVMHCLPVRRGLVISDEVLDGGNAIHLQQAKNRVPAAQAVFSACLKERSHE